MIAVLTKNVHHADNIFVPLLQRFSVDVMVITLWYTSERKLNAIISMYLQLCLENVLLLFAVDELLCLLLIIPSKGNYNYLILK